MSGRVLEEHTLQVWRAVVAAGASGISSAALHDKLYATIDSEVITSKCQSLLRGGYIARNGVNRWGQWLITKDCKAPEGEVMPVWLYEPDDDANAAQVHEWSRRHGKAEVKLPAAPASVFNQAPVLDWKSPLLDEEVVATAGLTPERRSLSPEDESFVCALYSDGVLWLQANGQQFSLPLDYTRQLLHYLDKLRANDVVEDALHAAGAAS